MEQTDLQALVFSIVVEFNEGGKFYTELLEIESLPLVQVSFLQSNLAPIILFGDGYSLWGGTLGMVVEHTSFAAGQGEGVPRGILQLEGIHAYLSEPILLVGYACGKTNIRGYAFCYLAFLILEDVFTGNGHLGIDNKFSELAVFPRHIATAVAEGLLAVGGKESDVESRGGILDGEVGK